MGIRLFHEGQFEGRKVRVPVFLGRRPQESLDQDLQDFYAKLLEAIRREAFHQGQWSLRDRSGWPDNPSFQDLVAWTWRNRDERYLVVVNLSQAPAEARIPLPELGGGTWQLTDVLSGSTYERDGAEMQSPGLYVALEPWNYNLFECRRL
jgi:hypothetical protein